MNIALLSVSILFFLSAEILAQQPDVKEPALPEGAVARLGTLALRHAGEGHSVDFSPDGKTLAVACPYAGQVFLFDTETGNRIRVLQSKDGSKYLMALAYSPDGRTLAVDTMDGDLLFFDPATGNETQAWSVEGTGFAQDGSVTFSPDGKTVALTRESDFAVLEAATGNILFRHESRSEIQDLAFSPDGKKLAVGTITPGAQIWELATKKCLHNFEAQKIASCVAFSPDGKWLATGSDEIILWNAETGKEEFTLFGGDADDLFLKLAFTPDGKSLIAGSQECSVYEWDLKTRTQTKKFEGKNDVLRSMALSPDANQIAATFANNAICLWDRKSGEMLFSDGPSHTTEVETIAFSPDGGKLLTGGGNQSIHIWESPSGRHLQTLKSQKSGSLSAYSPDQKFLVTAWKWSPKLQVWDAKTGDHLRELDAGGARVVGIDFLDGGKEVVALSTPRQANSASLSRWQLETGERINRVERQGPYYGNFFALSPHVPWAVVGKYNGTTERYDLELWNARTGQIVGQLEDVPIGVQTPQFTLDGSFLVAGSSDNSISVWEIATGKKVLILNGHNRRVSHVAISPEGRTIASGSSSEFPLSGDPHKIRYWDLFTGQELAHHTGHDENTTALAFSPDGKYLATGLRDTTALIWKVPESVRNPAKVIKPTNVQELAAAWKDLKSDDPEKAYQAMTVLTLGENASVHFLKEHLKRMQELDSKEIEPLLSKLDHEDFFVRNRAQAELVERGDLTAKALRQFANETKSLEAKTRCVAVLKTLEKPFITSPGRLQNIRAIHVLGRIKTPLAQSLLREISQGTPTARETKAAKQRLMQRKKH